MDTTEIASLLTESYRSRDTSWVERLTKEGWLDLKEDNFVEENSNSYWVMNFKGPDKQIHGFKLNYTDKDQRFEYAGVQKGTEERKMKDKEFKPQVPTLRELVSWHNQFGRMLKPNERKTKLFGVDGKEVKFLSRSPPDFFSFKDRTEGEDDRGSDQCIPRNWCEDR